MRKLLLILAAALFAVTACACSRDKLPTPPDSPSDEEKNKTEYVRVYYDLAADDATVKDSTIPYSEEKKMYFSEMEKGCTEYSLLVAYRTEFVLVGWKKKDGTKFVVGTSINEDIVLTANWVDKNDTPMV